MLGWLWRVIVGSFEVVPPPPACAHKWEVYRTFRVTQRMLNHYGPDLDRGETYVLRCGMCGDLKNHSS